jgi:hypothetical protein
MGYGEISLAAIRQETLRKADEHSIARAPKRIGNLTDAFSEDEWITYFQAKSYAQA